MKIYVCVKHVPDSAATIKVVDGKRIDTGITFLVNPYDEHALTEAAKIAQAVAVTEVIAVCVGPPAAENTLRSALAMGAHRGILVTTEGETATLPDSMATARALAAAIKGDGQPDLILTGREGIDSEGMQTMFRLAHHLELPAATNLVALELADDHVVATCEKEQGSREVLRLARPCVLAAAKGLNTPKYPTFPDIVKARKKEIRTVAWEALELVPTTGGVEIEDLEAADEARSPRAIAGDAATIAAELVRIMREEAKVI
jgi:electron transfer flavoprotein beta subunit